MSTASLYIERDRQLIIFSDQFAIRLRVVRDGNRLAAMKIEAGINILNREPVFVFSNISFYCDDLRKVV